MSDLKPVVNKIVASLVRDININRAAPLRRLQANPKIAPNLIQFGSIRDLKNHEFSLAEVESAMMLAHQLAIFSIKKGRTSEARIYAGRAKILSELLNGSSRLVFN